MCARQYPGEKEITFPPYTCLESQGDARLERSEQGEVVIFPLKVPPNSQLAVLSHVTNARVRVYARA
jgi:hypothetical protein